MRKILLLLSFSISGGLLIFPRDPLLVLLILLCLTHCKWRIEVRRDCWKVYLFLLAFLVISLVRPGEIAIESIFSRLLHFLAAILLLQIYLNESFERFIDDFAAILKWMSFQAIATVILAELSPELFSDVMIGEQPYMTLFYIFNFHSEAGALGGIARPDGFFFEPGVFQIYLNLYLYIALHMRRNIRDSILALVAVMTTQSTTGILIALLLTGAALARAILEHKGRRRIIAFAFAILITPPLAWISYQNVNEKFYGAGQGSSWARAYDFYTGLNIIAEYPALGIGFDVDRYLQASAKLGYASKLTVAQEEERRTSNGLLQMFFTIGIPLGGVLLLGIFYQRVFPHRWLIAPLLLFSFIGEALVFTPFFSLILFTALVEKAQKSTKFSQIERSPLHD